MILKDVLIKLKGKISCFVFICHGFLVSETLSQPEPAWHEDYFSFLFSGITLRGTSKIVHIGWCLVLFVVGNIITLGNTARIVFALWTLQIMLKMCTKSKKLRATASFCQKLRFTTTILKKTKGMYTLASLKNRCPNQGLEVRAEQTQTLSGPSPLDNASTPKVTQSYPELPRVTQSYPELPRVTQSYPK